MASGYSLVSRDLWLRNFSTITLPSAAHVWYKAHNGLWWVGKIAHRAPPGHFFKQPLGPSLGLLLHHLVPGLSGPDQDQPPACPSHYRQELHLRVVVFTTPWDREPSPRGTADIRCVRQGPHCFRSPLLLAFITLEHSVLVSIPRFRIVIWG